MIAKFQPTASFLVTEYANLLKYAKDDYGILPGQTIKRLQNNMDDEYPTAESMHLAVNRAWTDMVGRLAFSMSCDHPTMTFVAWSVNPRTGVRDAIQDCVSCKSRLRCSPMEMAMRERQHTQDMLWTNIANAHV